MNTSEATNEIATALAKAQSEMKPAIKDQENPHFRSKYADLASVWESCRGPLTSNGISVVQDVSSTERGVSVVTRLTHSSGQWQECGPLIIPLSKPDAHGVGSATTYGKRFSLAAAVGVVAEDDDDGNAAVAKGKPQRDEARSIPRDAPKASGVLVDRDTGAEVTLLDPPSPEEPAERDKALHHIKAMSDSLGLQPGARMALWKTHVGNYASGKAPLDKLQALEASLQAQCAREGK